MERELDLRELLPYIDPAALSYQDWCNVGMALKQEGYSCDVWDEWSRADSRYHAGECWRKWESFRGSASPVTGGTIVQMAKERGWRPSSDPGHELDWDAEIGGKEVGVIVKDPGWIEQQEIQEPERWEPVKELIRYLDALFDSTDNVGYVTKSFVRDGKHMPTKGNYDRTAGELIQALQGCDGDIGSVLGDYDQGTGAWIRFNPLDGKGVRNENVTDYRFALVESDKMDLATQNAMIRELELPVAALVYSGKKSIHAIVRIEAATYEEYRKRVDYLYTGPAHLYTGQEAAAVGMAYSLTMDDYIFGSHRSHGEVLAKGFNATKNLPEKELYQIMKDFYGGALLNVVEKENKSDTEH